MRAYSHSALKQFNNCPRQYHEVRVLKKWPKEETEQTIYGTDLHKAAENYIKYATPLPVQFKFMQPYLDTLIGKPGRIHAELKLAVTVDLKPCDFFADNVWMRGIVDVAIIDDSTAWVCDWKTGGNKYPDKDQLTLMALLLFAHYPTLEKVKSALLFVLKDDMVKHETYRTAATRIWGIFREDVAKIEKCHEVGRWAPKQSGLCRRHCPVLSCEHCGRNGS